MSVIYQTTITRIGQSAKEALGEQMLITFREGAPADIEEFCFIHCHGELTGALQPGARCELGQHCYPVTAVGSVAEQNARPVKIAAMQGKHLHELQPDVIFPHDSLAQNALSLALKLKHG